MAKTKRVFIVAATFLSGAAAILSLAALGTEGWITSQAVNGDDNNARDKDFISVGLFSGVFVQTTAIRAIYQLTMACAYDLNICALLCGENMVKNLKRLYREEPPSAEDMIHCPVIGDEADYHAPRRPFIRQPGYNRDKVFINAGVRLCTIIFMILSGVSGTLAAALSVLNTVTTPSISYFNILGLYICNGVAFFSTSMALILWAVLYVKDLLKNIPTYQTFVDGFSTYNYAKMGYSYWMVLVALFLYMGSIALLYYRNYSIEKDFKRQAQDRAEREPL